MKVVAKPVDMVVWFTREGAPKPIRFRLETDNGESVTIAIDRIFHKDLEKLAGNNMLLYRCEGCINGVIRQFEVKYELNTCRWILFRIF